MRKQLRLKLDVRFCVYVVSIGVSLLGYSSDATATVWFVNNAPGRSDGDGTSWNTARTTLQGALDAAGPGDQIWVAKGTYHPTKKTDSSDARSATFQLKNGVTILGGFVGAETSPDQRLPGTNFTILSGDLDGYDYCTADPTSDCCWGPHWWTGCDDPTCEELVCTSGQGYLYPCCSPSGTGWNQHCADLAKARCGCLCRIGKDGNAYHVVTGSNTDSTAVLDGFIIEAGNASGSQVAGVINEFSEIGGGVYINAGSPKFVGCTIRANAVSSKGGGIYIKNGNPILTDCLVSGNSSLWDGGGMYVEGGNPTFTRCAFESNQAANYGGGAYTTLGKPTFTDCTFTTNEVGSSGYGGGLYGAGMTTSPGIILSGCTFTGNLAGSSGGGVALVAQSGTTLATVTNTTFSANQLNSGSGQGAGMSLSGTDATLTDCLFEGNGTTVRKHGGGVAVASNSVVSLVRCEFMQNEGSNGGGVYVTGSQVILSNCDLNGNLALADGGGVQATGSTNSIVVSDCSFTANRANQRGGGLAQLNGNLTLRGSSFSGNYAESGGGVFVGDDTESVLEDCILEDNGHMTGGLITKWGGGIYFGGTNAKSLRRCRVSRNQASNLGGGVFMYLKTPPEAVYTIDSCLIDRNRCIDEILSSGYAGGVYVTGQGGTARLVNCTVVENTAWDWGGGLFASPATFSGSIQVDNSIFWGNSVDNLVDGVGAQIASIWDLTVRHSNVENGLQEVYVQPDKSFVWAPENLAVDPLFADPGNGDYHLSPGPPTASPCIDAGDSGLIDGLLDLDRGARVVGCEVDVGAIEYAIDLVQAPTPGPTTTPMNRFISFVPGSPGSSTAIRVKLLSMYDPNPSPPNRRTELTNFEHQVRWVGPPEQYLGKLVPSDINQFAASRLLCSPYYRDWSRIGEDVLHVCSPESYSNAGLPCLDDCECRYYSWYSPCSQVGTCIPLASLDPAHDLLYVTDEAIVPDSIYEVQSIGEGQEVCGDRTEAMFTAPLTVRTGRWGDVATPFRPPSTEEQPDALDIVGIVDRFKGANDAPGIGFAQLQPSLIDLSGLVDALDVTALVDAFKHLPYSNTPSAAAACPCSADIRVDSNNDGKINYADELVENVPPGVIIYVNDDDDNFNGVPDLEESPVADENDLAEIRLPQDCYPRTPATAWWSISWFEVDPQNPSMKVWLAPDKSGPVPNGAYEPGGGHQPWPPPQALWMETLWASAASVVAGGPSNELEITFAVSDDGSAQSKSNSVKAKRESNIRVNLRVVMLVEPGADFDLPLQPTGGTMLSQQDVEDVVVTALRQFFAKSGAYLKSGYFLKWGETWNLNPKIRLESNCFAIGPAGAMCGDLHTEDNNPRLLPAEWYLENVVGQDGNTDAGLIGPCTQANNCCDGDISHPACPSASLCCLGFDEDLCTLNLYFIGNMINPLNPDDEISGATISEEDVGKPWILLPDLAGPNLLNPGNPTRLIDEDSFLHEFFCHWIGDHDSHSSPPPEGMPCVDDDPQTICDKKALTALCSPQLLCYPGGTRKSCTALGFRQYRVEDALLSEGRARLNACKVTR